MLRVVEDVERCTARLAAAGDLSILKPRKDIPQAEFTRIAFAVRIRLWEPGGITGAKRRRLLQPVYGRNNGCGAPNIFCDDIGD
jgi:hypothetical protein